MCGSLCKFDCFFRKDWTIRKQLLTSFSVLASASLIIICVLSVTFLLSLTGKTEPIASDSLVAQVETNMRISASESGSVIQEKILRIKSNALTILVEAAQLFFTDSFRTQTVPTTSYMDFDETTLPPLELDPRSPQPTDVSLNYSSVYHGDYTKNDFPGQGSFPNIGSTVHLDTFFKSIYLDHFEIVQMYIAFPDIFRLYPGQTIGRPYDQTQRGWYLAAKAAARGEFIITDTYFDLFGKGWMITICQAIYNSDGNFLGVVGLDVTTTTIQNKILSIELLSSGFAALIQSVSSDGNRRGVVVAHPLWDPNDPDYTVNAPTIDEIDHDFPQSLVLQVISSNSGVIRQDRLVNGIVEPYIISHNPVLSNRYIVLILVPESEALSALPPLVDKMSDTKSAAFTTTIIVSAITLVITLLIVYTVSNVLSKPLQEMSHVASEITNNAAEKDEQDFAQHLEKIENIPRDDELGQLVHTFKQMISGLHEKQQKKRKEPKYPLNPFYSRPMAWDRDEIFSDASQVPTQTPSQTEQKMPPPQYQSPDPVPTSNQSSGLPPPPAYSEFE